MPIAKEARLILTISGILIAVAHYNFGFEFAWPLWAILAVLLFIFRDFKRSVPAIPLAVVSPVDGKVCTVDETQDPYLDRSVKRVRLRQSILGEYNVHSPIEGKVQNLWVISPIAPESSQLAVWIQTDESDDAVMVANLNSPLRHASCGISVGEKLGQGQRCGFLAFACEVDIYLPTTAHIAIKEGQSVRAGSDKLAEFIHDTTK